MARRVLRASTLCFSTLVLAWCLPSVGAQMLKGRPPGDGQVAPQKGGGVIASSLDASPRAGAAAGGVEDKLTLLAGEGEPSGEATSDAVNEKIRKAFNSKSSGGDTSAAESAASAVVTNQLQQPAAEQHGNTRRVMGSDTPPPVAAGASAALDEKKPEEKEEKDVKINAANEAPKAEAKKEAPKRAEGYGLSILAINGSASVCTESPITVMWVAPSSHSVMDFLALYKEGSPSFFSLQELIGTEGKAQGEITFKKPSDLNEGDPRLPALPGDYIVKYQLGNTKEVKQEKKFTVQKCEPISPAKGGSGFVGPAKGGSGFVGPAEGGAKARAGDDRQVSSSVKAGDDPVKKPKEDGQAEASSAAGKKEGSKLESDGQVGNAVEDQKAAATNKSVISAANQVTERQSLAASPSQQGATAAALEEKKPEEKEVKMDAANEAPKAEVKKEAPKPEEKEKEVKMDAANEALKAEAKKEAPKPEEKEKEVKMDAANEAPKAEAKKEAPKPEEKEKEVKMDAANEALKAEAKKEAPKPEEKEKEVKMDAANEAPKAEAKKEAPKPEEKEKAVKMDAANEALKAEAKKEAPKPEEKEKAVKMDAANEAPKAEAKKEAPKPEEKEKDRAVGALSGKKNQTHSLSLSLSLSLSHTHTHTTEEASRAEADKAISPSSSSALEKKEGADVSKVVSGKEKQEGQSPLEKTDDANKELPPKEAVTEEASRAEPNKATLPSISSALERARQEALAKDWAKLEQAGANKVLAPKPSEPASNPNSPEGKGPPGGQGRNGPGEVVNNQGDAGEGDEWGDGSESVGKIAPMTRDQEEWLNGPRSKGALAGRDKEGSAPSAPQGREPQGEKGKEKGAPEEAPRPAGAQDKEDKEVRPQAVGSGGKDDSGGKDGSKGNEGKSKQASTTEAKDSKAALKAADAVGSDAHKKHAANKESTSKMQKAETDGSGKGTGKAAGGFAGLLAMAGISPAPSPLLMGAAGGGLCLLLLGAFVVRQKLKGSKTRGGDAAGSYFSIEMSDADLEAGVVNEEFNLLATVSSDVCTGGAGGRRDEGDGWGNEDGWDEDFEDQTSYPTLTALDKNGIKVLFDFEKSDPDSFTTIIMATIRNSAKDDLTNFSCKVAVPKHLQITIGPPSSTILRGNGGAITQTMNVTNAHRGVQPLKMRMVLGYDRNGKKERQEADIANFPKEL